MARFYARFDHGVESSLEAQTTSNFYERRVITSATASGGNIAPGNPDLKTGLITSRSVLSDAMYAQMDGVNRDPAQGPIIPTSNAAQTVNNITRSGGNLSWTNIYKTTAIPGVAYPADFRIRPTSSIFTDDGNLTAASPADGGTISDSLYTAAGDAVYSIISSVKKTKSGTSPAPPPYTEDGSPYTRLGTSPSRTLHSIWHDVNLNFFAWDDFTPGQVQTFTASPRANGAGVFTIDFNAGSVTNGLMVESGVDSVFIRFNWTNEYLADLAGDSILNSTATPSSGTTRTLSSYNPGQGVLQYDWDLGNTSDLSSNVAPGRELTLGNSNVKFKDAVIPAHTGIEATISSGVVATVLRVQQKSIKFVASPTTVDYFCTNNVAASTYYSNDLSGQYVLTTGAVRVFTSKTSGASLGAGFYIGGNVATPVGSGNSFTWWSSDGGDIDNTGTHTCS
jgi:hypothetical protein